MVKNEEIGEKKKEKKIFQSELSGLTNLHVLKVLPVIP